MKMANFSRFLILFILPGFFLASCTKKTTPASSSGLIKTEGNTMASAPCIIYKTKSDYGRNIPVTLSSDRSAIVSYPDISDIYYKGKLAYPTSLRDGYLLDNRGIGPNVAFLNFTYEEYKSLSKTPSAGDLMKRVLDRDPLLEMYQCGNRQQYTDIETELNDIISSGKLADCKKLK
jgi:hypothetical protein